MDMGPNTIEATTEIDPKHASFCIAMTIAPETFYHR
jgi:hypothetical protein